LLFAAAAGAASGLLRPIAIAASLALFAAACSDPRARPVGPSVQVMVTPRTVVTSPGTLTGSIDVYDATGIDSVRVRVELGTGGTIADSTFFPGGSDPFNLTLPMLFELPGGLLNRTEVRIVARARSYLGLAHADTLLTAVGDTL
jgi:hypothetical protein